MFQKMEINPVIADLKKNIKSVVIYMNYRILGRGSLNMTDMQKKYIIYNLNLFIIFNKWINYM